MRRFALWSVLLMAGSVLAAPAKVDPVAEGFPDWQGAVDKNHITGRSITASDLRHKVTVVVEVDGAEGVRGQMLKAGDLTPLNGICGFHAGDNWETYELPRNVMIVFSVRGSKTAETVLAALKGGKNMDENEAKQLANLRSPSLPFYENITFTGAPDAEGKRPFVYVMGPTGKTPVWSGALTPKSVKTITDAVRKESAKIAPGSWRPFYGSILEVQHHPAYTKAIEKGKLTGLKPLLQKSIVGKDAEKATEAQILYDAMEQTRSDLALRIMLEAGACPHRAAYDMSVLTKYWPGEKKKLADAALKIKSLKEAQPLVVMFVKIMPWADPNFKCKNAAEAKSIVAQLNQMKKTLEKLKESKNITVQNGALTIDTMIDGLISTIPSSVPEK